MKYTTFIDPAVAFNHLKDPEYIFIDCSYALTDQHWGYNKYKEAHIPGALYADLHDDLSGKIQPGTTGRHPLPTKEDLVRFLSACGITDSSQVVVYDSGPGFMAAARLWWLLNWAGHKQVAVLAGGLPAWSAKGFPVTAATTTPSPKTFMPHFDDTLLANADEVLAITKEENAQTCLIDSRAADRYAGQNETIDPVAGHIPGAESRPFNAVISEPTAMPDTAAIKKYFAEDFKKEEVIFYCGSGVTAAFNILLAVHAGFPFPKLYAGSWSEWITNPARPVA
jgi:thiosulfate/3-mercaptopyruvate sulfurtransferase